MNDPDAPPGATVEDDLLGQARVMVRAFWASRQRNRLVLLAVALVGVILATAWMQFASTPGTSRSTTP